jgi:hypothetical protein
MRWATLRRRPRPSHLRVNIRALTSLRRLGVPDFEVVEPAVLGDESACRSTLRRPLRAGEFLGNCVGSAARQSGQFGGTSAYLALSDLDEFGKLITKAKGMLDEIRK